MGLLADSWSGLGYPGQLHSPLCQVRAFRRLDNVGISMHPSSEAAGTSSLVAQNLEREAAVSPLV